MWHIIINLIFTWHGPPGCGKALSDDTLVFLKCCTLVSHESVNRLACSKSFSDASSSPSTSISEGETQSLISCMQRVTSFHSVRVASGGVTG